MGKDEDKHKNDDKQKKEVPHEEDPCEKKKRLEAERLKAEKLAKQEEARRIKAEKAAKRNAENEKRRLERLAKMPKPPEKHTIGFLTRDTAIRYFGYAQEVGYVLQKSLGYNFVHFLLLPAWATFTYSYIFRDAFDKAYHAKLFCPKPVPPPPQPSYLRDLFQKLHVIKKKPVLVPPSESYLRSKARINAFDALAWQSITSILIPALILRKGRPWAQKQLCNMGVSYRISQTLPTVASIALLPILSKPIDKSVDFIFDHTIRLAFPDAYKENTYLERPPN